jgi:hypothetical protein
VTTTIIIWAALFGALVNRARGHDWGISTQFNRVMFGVAWGLTIGAAGFPFWPLFIITGWLSCVFGHGAHQRMHRQVYGQQFDHTEKLTRWLPHVVGPWRDNWSVFSKTLYQIIGMSFIGLVRMAVALLPILLIDAGWYWKFSQLGLFIGPLYWLGWQCSRDWNISWRDWPKPFRAGSDFGDLFVGAWTFGVLAAVLL